MSSSIIQTFPKEQLLDRFNRLGIVQQAIDDRWTCCQVHYRQAVKSDFDGVQLDSCVIAWLDHDASVMFSAHFYWRQDETLGSLLDPKLLRVGSEYWTSPEQSNGRRTFKKHLT